MDKKHIEELPSLNMEYLVSKRSQYRKFISVTYTTKYLLTILGVDRYVNGSSSGRDL